MLILAVFAGRFPAQPALWVPWIWLWDCPRCPPTTSQPWAPPWTKGLGTLHPAFGRVTGGQPYMANHHYLPKIAAQRQSGRSGNPAALLGSHQLLWQAPARGGGLPALLSTACAYDYPVPWHPMELFSLMPPERWEEVEWVCYLPLQNRDTLCLRNISILLGTGSLSHAL